MHRFNLSMHILHVFSQEFEMFLNLCCGLGRHTNARSRSKARPLHLTRGVLFLLDLYIPRQTSFGFKYFTAHYFYIYFGCSKELSTYNLPMLWLHPHLYDFFFLRRHPSRYGREYSVARRGAG